MKSAEMIALALTTVGLAIQFDWSSWIHVIRSPVFLLKSALILFLLFLLYSRYKFVQKLSHIPGLPMTFAIVGSSHLIRSTSKRHGKLAIAAKDFLSSFPLLNLGGDRGIYTIWLSARPCVMVVSPEGIKQVLTGKETMRKGPIYDIIEIFFGDGIVTSHSERWVKHRKLVTPAFRRKMLESVALIVKEQGQILISRLESEAGSKEDRSISSLVDYVFPATLDVLCESSMGVKIESQLKPSSRINVTLRAVFEVLVHYIMTPWMWITPVFNMSPFGRAAWKHVNFYNQFCEKVIFNRMQEMRQENNNLPGEAGDAEDEEEEEEENKMTQGKEPFMDILLREHLKNPKDFTLRDVQDETNIFVAAGHDTTGWGISYTLYLLGNHPEAQAKVHEEIDSLYGTIVNDGDELTPDILKHFKYVEAAFKESLRLYTPIPSISRVTDENITICDYDIPKGTEIVIPLFLIHRDAKYWPEPDKFKPERFLDDSTIHPYSYVPFAAGPRNCIGQKYAEVQSKSFLVQILRRYTIQSITPAELIPTYIAPVAVSSKAIQIKLHKRFEE